MQLSYWQPLRASAAGFTQGRLVSTEWPRLACHRGSVCFKVVIGPARSRTMGQGGDTPIDATVRAATGVKKSWPSFLRLDRFTALQNGSWPLDRTAAKMALDLLTVIKPHSCSYKIDYGFGGSLWIYLSQAVDMTEQMRDMPCAPELHAALCSSRFERLLFTPCQWTASLRNTLANHHGRIKSLATTCRHRPLRCAHAGCEINSGPRPIMRRLGLRPRPHPRAPAAEEQHGTMQVKKIWLSQNCILTVWPQRKFVLDRLTDGENTLTVSWPRSQLWLWRQWECHPLVG